jgi:hypothetical protein
VAHKEQQEEAAHRDNYSYVRGWLFLQKNPKHPTVINKLFIRDPSDLRIKHVNSKTVAF